VNIYMICTLWTPFQAERDWTNSYREILLIPGKCSTLATILREVAKCKILGYYLILFRGVLFLEWKLHKCIVYVLNIKSYCIVEYKRRRLIMWTNAPHKKLWNFPLPGQTQPQPSPTLVYLGWNFPTQANCVCWLYSRWVSRKIATI